MLNLQISNKMKTQLPVRAGDFRFNESFLSPDTKRVEDAGELCSAPSPHS